VEKAKPKEPSKRELNLDKMITRNQMKAATEHKAAEREAAKKAAAAQKAADERAARERADAIRDAVIGLSNGLSKGVGVEVPGPGGTAYVNYAQLLQTKYQRSYDQALVTAGDIARGDASVDVSVTVARDGKVIGTRVSRRSGNTTLDRLVQGVLDRVDDIAPFPDGAKDERRTFNLTFELKAKRFAG
jgi:TolA protein